MNDHDQPARLSGQQTVEPDPGTELARHLADIANVMLAPGSATTAAERIVTLVVATMDTCDEAALCASDPGQPPSGSTLMVELDAVQVRLGQGPCPDALGGVQAIYVPDLLDDRSWPLFSPEAVQRGFRSTLAYRLSFDGETVGALQLYAQLPGAFNATERAQGLIFASYAGLALAVARAQSTARAEEDRRTRNFESALSSREVIGQAQGILMERERITADQAFQLLRRSSQHLNRKLRAVAQDVVDFGTMTPEAPVASE